MNSLLRNLSKFPKNRPRCACLSFQKSPEEATETPETSSKTSVEAVKYSPRDVTKADMQWKTPWHKNEGEYYSALKAMYSDDNQTSMMKLIQTPVNLSPSSIKKWWVKRRENTEAMMQMYLPERNQTLGNELAAAHFVVHRGGAVKFFGEENWVKADKNNNYKLPRFFEADKILEAIDCTDMNLYYEGLANFRNLKQVEWLSFNGVGRLDDWFLDRITNVFSHSLLYLDLRNCPKYTERGLGALYKMDKLKILCLDDMLMTTSFEMTCLMLQEVMPNLDIRVGE